MVSKTEILGKINSLKSGGKFINRTRKLITSDEWNKPLTSQEFIDIYNNGPGKNIKTSQLTAGMQPFLKNDIVKSIKIKKENKEIKIWFPAWINKKEIIYIENNSIEILKTLHVEIKKVSENLFNDGHYAPAIEEAFKKVINLVKKKSGRNDLDGYSLMSTVFSPQHPILKFNRLIDKSDRDEQQGWMHLYQGAVLGIRNVKAHKNIIQKNKQKTFEHLAFASLLCRKLDEAIKV